MYVNTKASISPNTLSKTDSVKNCVIRFFLNEPNTLRTPTSFARLAERAVERFIKFTQAISSIKNAMAEKIYTYCILPFASSSAVLSECKWISRKGVKL